MLVISLLLSAIGPRHRSKGLVALLSGIIVELLTGKFPAQHATVNPPFLAMRQVRRDGDQSIAAVLVHGSPNEIEPRPSYRVVNTRQLARSLRKPLVSME